MSETPTLKDWIAAATRGLPPSAVTKFSAEIEDHAAESRRKHIEQGMPADEAERAALIGLGDPAQVARTFRDAHFSRREYTRGMVAVIALMAIIVISVALRIISNAIDEAHQLNIVGQWEALWQIAYPLANGVMVLLMLRAALTFLREQYDIHAPRWGWPALVISLIVSNVPGALRAAEMWLYTYSPFARQPGGPALPEWTYGLPLFLTTFSPLGLAAAGALIGAFCLRSLPVRLTHSQRLRAALLILGAAVGAGLALTGDTFFASVVLRLNYYVARSVALLASALSVPEFAAQTIISLAFALPLFALLAMLLGLFIHMRRPGAAVAR